MNVNKLSDRMLAAYINDRWEEISMNCEELEVDVTPTGSVTGAKNLHVTINYESKIPLSVYSDYFKLTDSKIDKMLDTLNNNYYKLMGLLNNIGSQQV